MVNTGNACDFCKRFLCNVIGFAIFHVLDAATGGVLQEMVFLEIHRKTPVAKSLF